MSDIKRFADIASFNAIHERDDRDYILYADYIAALANAVLKMGIDEQIIEALGVERDAALNEVEEAWSAFGDGNNREVLNLAEQIHVSFSELHETSWQPISTAPRDSTDVLCFSPGKRHAGNENARIPHCRVDFFRESRRCFGKEYPEAPYTHWQQLPKFPVTKS